MIDTQKVMIDTQKVMIAKLQKSSKALNLGILKKLFTGLNFKNFKNFKRACVYTHEILRKSNSFNARKSADIR